MATSVTQFGITWTFDTDYTVGQFANGDYYVLGPVEITDIDPGDTTIGSDHVNGSMIDPDPGTTQGYDQRHGSYDSGLNVGLSLPFTVSNGSCLVSTINHVPTSPDVTLLYTCAILTVLASAPAANSFRPGYCATTKTVQYDTGDLNYGILQSLALPASAPSMASAAALFERPWLDHVLDWTGRYFHPEVNMEEYGVSLTNDIGIGALMLHSDYSNAQKETLMIRFVQLGIDFYERAINSDGWEPDGGHSSGRKWPIIFAGLALGVSAMRDIGPGDTSALYFGEDAQTFVVTQADVDRADKLAWTGPYVSGDIGLAEYGIRHATYPTWDSSYWDEGYNYRLLNGGSWPGIALAALMCNAKSYWDHDVFFDYVDRYYGVEGSAHDTFTTDMWDDYRDDYPIGEHYIRMY